MNNLISTFISEAENHSNVQNFIEYLLDEFRVSPKISGRIMLSVTEAVNNAIIHGNQNHPEKRVILKAWLENNQVFVSIEDEGEGFDYTRIPDPTLPENRVEINGRGLYLMKILSDNLIFQNNGSKVIMTFILDCEQIK